MIDCVFFDVADTLLEKPDLMPLIQSVLIDRHGLFPYFDERRITSLHQRDRFWSDQS